MQKILFFSILGYISGGVLYARLWGEILKKENITENSKDGNPGTANAFLQGGFWCGILTLLCDLMKGFVPVWLYLQMAGPEVLLRLSTAFVIAAPVIGHAYPILYKFHGGKAIAVTFGVLLALIPYWTPVLVLAISFLFFSLVICIQPHYYRTFVTYFVTMMIFAFSTIAVAVKGGFFLITVAVATRLMKSKEPRERMRIKVLWTH